MFNWHIIFSLNIVCFENLNELKSTDYQWNFTDFHKKRLLWISQIALIASVKVNWFNSEKYFFTDESVNRQITGSISEIWLIYRLKECYKYLCYKNLTSLYLDSTKHFYQSSRIIKICLATFMLQKIILNTFWNTNKFFQTK